MRQRLAVHAGWKTVPFRTEVQHDGAVGGEKALGLSWRFEPLHAPFSLTGRLVGVLRAVVQVAVLAVFDAYGNIIIDLA